jgi:hypothetical protein
MAVVEQTTIYPAQDRPKSRRAEATLRELHRRLLGRAGRRRLEALENLHFTAAFGEPPR